MSNLRQEVTRFADGLATNPQFQEARMRSMGASPAQALQAVQPLVERRDRQQTQGMVAQILNNANGRPLSQGELMQIFAVDPATAKFIAEQQAEMQARVKHKFNPVTGGSVLIDEATGMPIAGGMDFGGANDSMVVSSGEDMTPIQVPAQFSNNPAAKQKYLESYAGAQGKIAAERPMIEQKKKGARDAKKRAGGTVIQDINRAINIVQKNPTFTTGYGGLIDFLPETDAKEVEGYIQSALSNVGLDTLQEMRENSPTGGALGQVPIQQQKRLEQVLGSLDKTQSADVVMDNLRRVNNIYMDIIYGQPEELDSLVQDGQLIPQEAEQYKQRFTLSFDEFGKPINQSDADLSQYSLEELEAMLKGGE